MQYCHNPLCKKEHDHIKIKHADKVFCSVYCRDEYILQLEKFAEATNPFGRPLHKRMKKWYE